MSNTNFVHHYPFSSPLQRLIMIRILMAGSLDGEGERVLGHDVLANFCCCSKQMIFKEVKNLEQAGHLTVRQIGGLVTGLKVCLGPALGYTITPTTGDAK